MRNSLFASLGALAPLHVLWRKFVAADVAAMALCRPHTVRHREALFKAPDNFTGFARAKSSVRPAVGGNTPPLRVIRLMETGQASAHGGRMLISGRMADVCAELDRMAAREMAHTTTRSLVAQPRTT